MLIHLSSYKMHKLKQTRRWKVLVIPEGIMPTDKWTQKSEGGAQSSMNSVANSLNLQ